VRIRIFVLAAVVSLTATAALAQSVKRHGPTAHLVFRGSFENLGTTVPFAINNRGEVVGQARTADGEAVAFLWTERRGFRVIVERAAAVDVNTRGDVVGHWDSCGGASDCDGSGFLWSRESGFRDLGGFLPYAINKGGDMAGVCWSGGMACVVRDGILETNVDPDNPIPPTLYGINEGGDAVGENIVWRKNGSPTPFGTASPSLFDINKRGTIVGSRFDDGRNIPTVWTRRGPVTHPLAVRSTWDGWVLAINSLDQVVGSIAHLDENVHDEAFYWDVRTGAMTLLSRTVGRQYTSAAVDINNSGYVVGWVQGPKGLEMIVWRVQ
jgi:probable HAF family extracellular repeat protein